MTLYLSQKKLLLLLLASFAAGFLLALLYDVFRLLRMQRHPKRKFAKALHYVLVSLEDILFFLFAGVVFAILFFVTNNGKVRPSAFVMAFLGFVLCRNTLSRLTLPLLAFLAEKLKQGVCLFAGFLCKRVLLPPVRKLSTLVKKAGGGLALRHRRRKTEKILAQLKGLGRGGYFQGLRRL